jgi:hypothetical protein
LHKNHGKSRCNRENANMAIDDKAAQSSSESASGYPLNEGALLLRAAGTISETAEASGCSRRSITSYRTGKVPDLDAQTRLLVAFGIPRAAWRRPPPKFAEPPWLDDAYAALRDREGACAALLRGLIVASGDEAELAEHDALYAKLRAKHPGLWEAVDQAEASLAAVSS